jgi:hypothetical protein
MKTIEVAMVRVRGVAVLGGTTGFGQSCKIRSILLVLKLLPTYKYLHQKRPTKC